MTKRLRLVVFSLLLLLVLTFISAADFSITKNRYIVDDICDFTVSVTDRKESLLLTRRLLSSVLGNLLEKPCYLTLIELPEEGKITFGREDVVVLDTFKLGGFRSLRITPAENTPASFCFIATNKEGICTPLCRMTVIPSVTALAPTALGMTVETGCNMKVGSYLQGEGAGTLVYEVTSAPAKGDLQCFGAGFVYTPHAGKIGQDKFTYRVRDTSGAYSEEATVSVHIDKDVHDLQYCDMEGSLNGYAAYCLAREGILRGERVRGADYFRPQETLNQGEFFVLLMDAAGLSSEVGAELDATPITVAQATRMAENLLGYTIEIQPKNENPESWSATSVAALGDSLLTRDDAAGLLWQVYCAMQ